MRPDLFFLLLFAAVPALPQERSTDLADGPYWQRASALMEKRRRGEELSAPERDFLEEAKRWRRQLREEKAKRDPSDGTDGDGAQGIRSVVPPASLPAGTSPPKSLEIPSSDSPALPSFYRRPPGEGPFPALVFLHGGLKQMSAEELRRQLTENPVITRLLATGYLAVVSTFRDYEADIQSRQPIDDSLATIRAVANLDFVDPRRIALFGGSGGGNIALELASGAPVRAVVAGEPATVIYTGMLTTGDYGPRLEMMKTPEKYFDEKKGREHSRSCDRSKRRS